MLYVYYGSHTEDAADKANRLVRGLKQKRPNAEHFILEGEALTEGTLDPFIDAQGLFVAKHIVTIKQPLETPLGRDVFFDRIERLAASDNIFVVHEGTVSPTQKKKIEKHAAHAEECKEAHTSESAYNVFALGDALGARDRRHVWVKYHEALHAGIVPENIHGTLAWAVRNMSLASCSAGAAESGQKPFVYNKFKSYAQNYSKAELSNLSRQLITIYHNSRRGQHELSVALERFLLTI